MFENFLLTGTLVPVNREVCTRGGGCKLDFQFFSLFYCMPAPSSAPRGMASQHLRTVERVPVNKEFLTGTPGQGSRSITSSKSKSGDEKFQIKKYFNNKKIARRTTGAKSFYFLLLNTVLPLKFSSNN